MATDLHAALRQLAATSGEGPILSIYADWGQTDSGQRPARRQIEQELERLLAEQSLHGEAHEQARQQLGQIMGYLDTQAPADATGIAVFSSPDQQLWQALPLHAPVQTSVALDRFPHLFQLARIADDNETYALVIAEGQEAQIFVIAYNQPEHVAATEADEKIKRFDQGGQAQMLFQRRTDNVIKAHIKDLAQELGQVIERYGVEHVILSSNDAIKGIVLDTLPKHIQDLAVAYINLDPHADMASMMATITPLMTDVERQKEQQIATELENEVGADARGVAGTAATALALSKGQVRTLVMQASFAGSGRINPSSGFLFAPGYLSDPYDGTPLSEIDLREAFVFRALQQGADVEIVEESAYLASNDGVGALLHYRDDVQAKQAGGS
ncbi:hypothetical protein F8S13_04330 [Chloroflexia bacterium SDU3-3]|nr:hypothetical protein F8S13_04330 [Chloroflexia bacterium SDU3-3]